MTATGTSTQTPVLEARNVRVTFPGGTTALDDVSLRLAGDEFLVVLGPSGAGKSTLLRTLNRLRAPTSGGVFFKGTDVTRCTGAPLRRLRQGVGMIFQQFHLVGRLSVLDNVLAGRLRFCSSIPAATLSHLRLLGKPHRESAMQALERVGVAHLAARRADTLSGGQQQRVAIARVLAQEPSVILADEPIASLDPRSADIVMDLLRDIHVRHRLPVIANLHQVAVARTYATRIVGMRAGRVVFEGAAADLDDAVARNLYSGGAEPAADELAELAA
ncbi:MAG: phosphonate ABC transporter ATP-binding protein [Phycisphaerales bacterium]|nr:phosphonate ABC transporter ATP-binding protein [Phycisphaerales bacterium]